MCSGDVFTNKPGYEQLGANRFNGFLHSAPLHQPEAKC